LEKGRDLLVKMESEDKTINVLVFLWHSTTDTTVTAGGYKRIIEFVKRIPEGFNFYILDNSPTIFDFRTPRFNVYEYKIPEIFYRILKINFMLGRFLEWLIASIKLFFHGNRILKQKKCQVIYLPITELLFVFLPAVLLRIIYRKKIVCDILNFEMPYGSVRKFYRQMRSRGYSLIRSLFLPLHIRIQYFIIKSCFKKIDCIMSVSQYLADYIRRGGAIGYIGFTPSGVNAKFIESFSDIPKTLDGVYVGRHEVEKGIFDLLEAWRIVIGLRPGSRLALVGPCNASTRRQIENKLTEYQINEYVSIKGALSEEEKIKTIKSGKVFIHLGKVEPLVPVITVLEALVCGLPVILYDQPSYREHPEIYKHPAFSLVSIGDFKIAAQEIVRYLNMNKTENDFVKENAQDYTRSFDWENISQIEYAAIRQVAFSDKKRNRHHFL